MNTNIDWNKPLTEPYSLTVGEVASIVACEIMKTEISKIIGKHNLEIAKLSNK